MAKAKKAAGGKAGSGNVDYGGSLVDQHRRMATGHLNTVNKEGLKKGGSAKKSGGRCK